MSFPGDHDAIVPVERFDAVQQRLAQAAVRHHAKNLRLGAPLAGKIRDDRGNRMSPSSAVKKGIRYRYYIAAPVLQGQPELAGSVPRVRALEIEALIAAGLRRDDAETGGPITALDDGDLLAQAVHSVVIRRDSIDVTLNHRAADDGPGRTFGCRADADEQRTLNIPWSATTTRRHREIILPVHAKGAVQPMRTTEQANLLRAIAQGRAWVEDLIEGRCSDLDLLAAREGKTERSIRLTLSLAFLDPALVKAAVQGQLPRGYGIARMVDLPMAWPDQWRVLGLQGPVTE